MPGKTSPGRYARYHQRAQLGEFRSQTRQRRDIRNVSALVEVTPATTTAAATAAITITTTTTCCEESTVEITMEIAGTFAFASSESASRRRALIRFFLCYLVTAYSKVWTFNK